jgi:hypothetical protein
MLFPNNLNLSSSSLLLFISKACGGVGPAQAIVEQLSTKGITSVALLNEARLQDGGLSGLGLTPLVVATLETFLDKFGSNGIYEPSLWAANIDGKDVEKIILMSGFTIVFSFLSWTLGWAGYFGAWGYATTIVEMACSCWLLVLLVRASKTTVKDFITSAQLSVHLHTIADMLQISSVLTILASFAALAQAITLFQNLPLWSVQGQYCLIMHDPTMFNPCTSPSQWGGIAVASSACYLIAGLLGVAFAGILEIILTKQALRKANLIVNE